MPEGVEVAVPSPKSDTERGNDGIPGVGGTTITVAVDVAVPPGPVQEIS